MMSRSYALFMVSVSIFFGCGSVFCSSDPRTFIQGPFKARQDPFELKIVRANGERFSETVAFFDDEQSGILKQHDSMVLEQPHDDVVALLTMPQIMHMVRSHEKEVNDLRADVRCWQRATWSVSCVLCMLLGNSICCGL